METSAGFEGQTESKKRGDISTRADYLGTWGGGVQEEGGREGGR